MKITAILPCAALLALGAAHAQQPAPTVPMTNTPCNDGPKLVGGKPDTVVSAPDAEGFISLFNGTNLQGWWENCNRHADADKTNGGIWVADPSSKILYSQQKSDGAGGMFTTNATYDNYEIIFDFWPTFGNDGGVFNRNTMTGKNWQTTLDYVQGSGVGGSFNENGWAPTNINDDPFRFNAGAENPTITSWTTFTQGLDPTKFGCSAGGCTAGDFAKVWNTNGWNQIRVKFYDGLVAGRSVTMETWMRKIADPMPPWVPVYKATKSVVTPAGYISLQIHQGTGRWKTGSSNLYRNIKLRRLKDDGSPLIPVPTLAPGTPKSGRADLKLNGAVIAGTLPHDVDVTIRDVRGIVVETFHAAAGNLSHALAASARGVLFVELKGKHGVDRVRLSRI